MITELMPILAAVEPDAAAATATAAADAAAGGIDATWTLAIAGAGSAIGVGMIGAKAVEAVGRNPGAFGNILTLGIIGMALAEAIAIYALVITFLAM